VRLGVAPSHQALGHRSMNWSDAALIPLFILLLVVLLRG
jgi:hypothetical protein